MRHHAHVIHHIPGRVRVKLPKAKGDARLLEEIRHSIAPLHGVKRVNINAATGSVLVHYDPDVHEDFHEHLSAHAERTEMFALRPPEITEADKIAEKIEAEAEFLAEHSESARAIVNTVKHLNEHVKQATGNAVDLKVLLPLGLAVYAFFKLGSEVSTPLWVTLGIFSFNSFVRLHRPAGTSVTVDEHEIIFDDPKKALEGLVSPQRRPSQAKRRRLAPAP